ncbi:MAG: regulatory protein LuxR [Flavipsychrobacter sp.]|jgi:DNA-binding CsgD family transcriptional regulator|nr:regulatory protein LuxR [Flavipsychrobacter sp.]
MPLKTFLGAILDGGEQKMKGEANFDKRTFDDEVLSWAKYFDSCHDTLCHVVPTTFIIDYKKSEIVYMSSSIENLLGVDRTGLLGRGGVVKFVDLVNPNDFKVYNEQIFPKQMTYLQTVPHEEAADIVFSNTLRIRQNNGHYKTLLIRKCFIIRKEDGYPLFEFGTLTDTSALKKELSINHTIERFRRGAEYPLYMKVVSEDYFPEMDANLLTAREKEILNNLSLGIKRKDVGKKLFISDNTVANHIKTILRKTNSKNIREAIAICKMNGII